MKFIAAVLVLFCSAAQAQLYKEGMLVTDKGDTLKGLLNATEKMLLYKPAANRDIEHFKYPEVRYYSIGEERYRCEPVEVFKGHFPEQQFACLELEIRGDVNLWRADVEDVYGGNWANFYLQTGDSELMRVWKSKRFRKQMRWFFQDNTELVPRIKSGEFTYESLGDLVRTHNEWAAKQPPPQSSE